MRKFLLAAAMMLAAPAAMAQTVQPQYVRQSKGQSLTVVNQPIWGPSGAVIPPDSAVLDWTAFAGVSLSFSRPPTSSNCAPTLRVRILGANATSGPFQYILDVPASEYDANESGTSWYAPVTTPYIKFSFYVYPAPDKANLCTDIVTLKATPIPFDYAAKPSVTIGYSLDGQTVTSLWEYVNNYSGVSTTGNGGKRNLRLQNLGTSPIGCGVGGFSRAGFILSAGTANNDGTGGTFALDGYSGVLRCKCMSTPPCTSTLGVTTW